MRERAKDIDRLYHIEESINHVMDFLEGKTFEEMRDDVMCFHAVVYNIMIIGEAANMLTKEFREEHSEVPWRNIRLTCKSLCLSVDFLKPEEEEANVGYAS